MKKGRAADEEVDGRSRVSSSEAVVKPARRPMKMMQSDEHTERCTVNDRCKVEFMSKFTGATKQAERRHYRPPKRDEYYSDSEDETDQIPTRQLDSRRKLRAMEHVRHKGDLDRELSHRCQRQRERDSFKENDGSSNEEWISSKDKIAGMKLTT